MSYHQPGPMVPTEPILKKRTYSAALSYVGITRRTTAWIRSVRNPGAKTVAIAAAIFFLLFMYAFLVFWYFLIFFLFGVFTFPFRLMRRGQRKQEHLQRQQLATMQAMYLQSQYQPGYQPANQPAYPLQAPGQQAMPPHPPVSAPALPPSQAGPFAKPSHTPSWEKDGR